MPESTCITFFYQYDHKRHLIHTHNLQINAIHAYIHKHSTCCNFKGTSHLRFFVWIVVSVMICLLHYLFHLLANFTQTLPSIRSEKQIVVKPDRPHLFSWTYSFSRMLQHIIKSPSTEVKPMGDNNDCHPPSDLHPRWKHKHN